MESKIYVKIPEMVSKGLVDMDDVDEAVRNVLRLKFRLGIFENPYTSTEGLSTRYLTADYRSIAEQLAIESAVLLKNDDLCRLEKEENYLGGNLLTDREASWELACSW